MRTAMGAHANLGLTGYTPCSLKELRSFDADASMQIEDLRSRSNLRSLAYKQACSLVSLDYVASGSTGRAKIAPRGAKTKKRQPQGRPLDHLEFCYSSVGHDE